MKAFIKNIVTGILIGLLIATVFIIIDVLSGETLEINSLFAKELFYYIFYSVVLTLINGYYFDYINAKYPFGKKIARRLLLGGLGAVVLTLAGIFLIRVTISIVFEGRTWFDFLRGERAIFYVISLLITVVISGFFHAFYFYKELQKNKIKEQKVIAGTATAQFDALKNQLDPHFLFNSLNVLTSLIEENPDLAQKFTTSLSKVYRYVLEQKNKDLVTVDEELDFARTYVSLLKMRFENSIIFEIPEKSTNPDAKLVPLSLQLLLENTVKHNRVNPEHPLHIKIYESNGNLVVENNLQTRETLSKSTGVGLRNIQQRYQILSTRQVDIEKTATHFRVQLPLLTKTLPIMKTQASENSYIRARKKVEELKEFYSSLASYVVVIPFLIFINYRTFWEFKWFWFPAIGWAIGLAFHAFKVYGPGFSWEERKLRQFMEEEKNKTKWY